MDKTEVGGPVGGVARIDAFVGSAYFRVSPNYAVMLPRSAAPKDELMLRMSLSGLPNYLWSNPLCKQGQCNGNWDPHLENFDRGLLGPIVLNNARDVLLANLTKATWKVCSGLYGEALNLPSPAASEPPGGWRKGGAPLAGTGTWYTHTLTYAHTHTLTHAHTRTHTRTHTI